MVILAFAQALITSLVVSAGLLALGIEAVVVLALSGIATATDPVAVADEVRESGTVGSFQRRLLGVVAVDDVFGIGFFTILMAIGVALTGVGSPAALTGEALWTILGAVLLGYSAGASGR